MGLWKHHCYSELNYLSSSILGNYTKKINLKYNSRWDFDYSYAAKKYHLNEEFIRERVLIFQKLVVFISFTFKKATSTRKNRILNPLNCLLETLKLLYIHLFEHLEYTYKQMREFKFKPI